MDWFKRTSTVTPGYYPPNIGLSCNLFPSKQHYSLTIFYTPLRLLMHASCYLVNDNKPSNASKSMSRSWHLLSFNWMLREHLQDAAIFHGKKNWLVVDLPSEKYESQWEGLSHIYIYYGKHKMFETTNQKHGYRLRCLQPNHWRLRWSK